MAGMKRGEPTAEDRLPPAPDPLRRAPGERARTRPRRDVQSAQPLPARGPRGVRRRLAPPRPADSAADDEPRRRSAQDDGHDPAGADDHRAQRVARHPVQPVDQSRTRAASTAASTAMRGRRTPITTCRPGLDFETKLFAKPNAPALLRAELGEERLPSATPSRSAPTPIRISRSSANGRSRAADSRSARPNCEHPFTIVTKSALVERDLDLIAPMAAKNMARVYISITTLDKELARSLEPRAATPPRRLQAVKALTDAGVPVGVLAAPVIPQLNDRDLEAILEAAAAHGARHAGWIMLRLPLEVAPLFRDWLDAHYPLRADHVMSVLRQLRGGRDYDARFGERMRGNGPVRRIDREALRAGVQAPGIEPRPHAARHLALSPAGARRPAPARPALVARKNGSPKAPVRRASAADVAYFQTSEPSRRRSGRARRSTTGRSRSGTSGSSW